MTQKTDINQLEAVPMGRLLLRFSLPAIATMTIFSLYNIISSIFIGQGVGALAIAGLAVTFPFMNLVFAVSMMVAVGGATVCSISLGAKDPETAFIVLGQNVVLSLSFAAVFGAVCLYFIDPLLMLFGASENTLPYAREYMEVILLCAPIGNLMVALNHFMRASGYPLRSMAISISSVVVNVILTPLFIYTCGWGIQGAAIATVLSQLVALVLMFVHYFDKRSTVHFKRGIFAPRPTVIRSMLAIGLSPFLMNACACLVVLLINVTLRFHGGDLSIGAYGVANRLLLLFGMIVIGLTQGMQPIVGFNYGARRMDRVKKVLRLGIIAGTAITTCGFIAFQIFPRPLALLFTDHAQLVDMAVNGLRLCSLVFFLVGSQIVIAAYFQSMGKASIAIFLSLSRQLLFLIPGLIFFPRWLGLDGVWISLPFADILASFVSMYILWRQRL